MRGSSRLVAGIFIAASSFLAWISGCSDLEEDCELLVNCPETKEPPECGGQIYSISCDACLQANCCQEVSDCFGNNPCGSYCMFSILPPPPECTQGKTGEYFGNLTTCLRSNCALECGGQSYCNPVTHNNCSPNGAQCAFVYPGIFYCIDDGGTAMVANLCESCNFAQGPYCGSGLACDIASFQCARYCCTDADCGTGYCELNQNVAFGFSTANPAEMVGLCLAMPPATGPACDAPPLPPASGGTCFTGYTP